MLYLILLVFSVFLIFFIGDFILTLKTIKCAGTRVELNPLMRIRGKFIYIFKIIEIIVFLFLIYFITLLNSTVPFYILLVFIFLYALLFVNNAHVYYKITGKESKAFKIIFMIFIVFMLLFIYLNYLLYSDLKIFYNALSKSSEKYSRLHEECSKEKTSINASLPESLANLLKELNLSIKR